MTNVPALPTPAQLGLVLHRMFVDIRNWAYAADRQPNAAEDITGVSPKFLAELADLAEIIPLQFINRHEEYLRIIAESIRDLAVRHPQAARYAAVLDMNPQEVAAVVSPVGHDWGAELAAQH